MSELQYRAGVNRNELKAGECVIFRSGDDGPWLFAFSFVRLTDGKPEIRIIPVTPNGEAQPLPHHTWGLQRAGSSRWQITPSIKCLDRVPNPQKDMEVEVWHETPAIVGVPDTEPWTAAP